MKLLFFIASLECGGAERVSARLCSYWAESGWDVTLATFDDGSAPPFYPLSTRVRHVTLDLKRRSTSFLHSLANNGKRIRRLRRFVAEEKPDRIVSFIDATNVLALIAARGRGIPVVVSERIDPHHHTIPWGWRALRRSVYPWAHTIVVQTQGAADFFPAAWRARIVVIPNPVPDLPAVAIAAPKRPSIVAMGRLDPQKGFDLLVDAFASIAASIPEWELTILGEGPERASLEARVARGGLAGRVHLPGRVTDVASVLNGAEIFVLSSRYEGFPNALLEAMAAGLAAVAFDCPSGPREIVRDGIDGILVPPGDVPALAEAVSSLARDPGRRRALGEKARGVLERFSMPAVAGMWSRVLDGAGTRES
ncbi:MAG TPA: glycosyltransferase family 4 protein [Candidatus Polarisedimenticolaceae bacterium]|nr:glycosyltransferase family 4 protein [Candidatus Polarisedimenticolaceae bacterium]